MKFDWTSIVDGSIRGFLAGTEWYFGPDNCMGNFEVSDKER